MALLIISNEMRKPIKTEERKSESEKRKILGK
jgi:hypothetical protein